jgi:hypothetical protein
MISIIAGLTSAVLAFALFLPIGLQSNYATAMFPTFVLAGPAFALAYGPLNIAATNGIAPEEQGLPGGLVNTSFQFGGALVLAIVTAVRRRPRVPEPASDAVEERVLDLQLGSKV